MVIRCLDVRDQLGAEALCCLDPRETEFGFKINSLVTVNGIEFNCRWLEEHCGISLYFDAYRDVYTIRDGSVLMWESTCPPVEDDIVPLSPELIQIMFVQMLLLHIMRIIRKINRYKKDTGDYSIYQIVNAIERFFYSYIDTKDDYGIRHIITIASGAIVEVWRNIYLNITEALLDTRMAFKVFIKLRKEIKKKEMSKK